MTAPDPWSALRRLTPARIALGRAGVSLPTSEWLRFGVAHAQARDAVHLPFDGAAVASTLAALGIGDAVTVESAAPDRATYLRRPDLGRRLSPRSAAVLAEIGAAAGRGDERGGDVARGGGERVGDVAARGQYPDVGQATGHRSDEPGAGDPRPPAANPDRIAVVVADGLSARAVHAHAAQLLAALRPLLAAQRQALATVVLAHQARVALGDEVGQLLHATALLVLIGERPGLSSPDSLGAYLTWSPRVGCSDAQRNCVSNIRPEGLAVDAAAARIAWLLDAARRLGATGVRLKDESGGASLAPPAAAEPAAIGAAASSADPRQSTSP